MDHHAHDRGFLQCARATRRGDQGDPVTAARCPTCDKYGTCAEHAADQWKARALAAEARIATVTATIEHDIAICREHRRLRGGLAYLERAVRDLHDERTQSVAADAARWRRVAPLIERLRPAVEGRDVYRSPYDLIDAVHFLLAATTDRAAPEGATT